MDEEILDEIDEMNLVKYDGYHKETYKTRNLLMEIPELKGFFKRVHLLNNTILVELKKGQANEKKIMDIIAEHREEIEKSGVSLIETCTKDSYLDLKLPDINLAPLILKDNAIKMDAFIEAGKVPDSFQLKGFMEFDIKLKLPF